MKMPFSELILRMPARESFDRVVDWLASVLLMGYDVMSDDVFFCSSSVGLFITKDTNLFECT